MAVVWDSGGELLSCWRGVATFWGDVDFMADGRVAGNCRLELSFVVDIGDSSQRVCFNVTVRSCTTDNSRSMHVNYMGG